MPLLIQTQNCKRPIWLSLWLARIGIPPVGHRPVPLERFLPPPWNEIFSPTGFDRLVDRSKDSLLPSVPVFDLFASAEERIDIYKALRDRSMLVFEPTTQQHQHHNGAFGLYKSESQQRFLVDLRRGNFLLRDMDFLQQLYSDWLHANPDQRRVHRAKGFELFCPSMLGTLPPDTCAESGSDCSNFFHWFQMPKHMQQCQRLAPVPTAAVGLDPVEFGPSVTPTLTTLAMGFKYATLIAQIAHEAVLMPSLSTQIRFRVPAHSSDAHVRRYARMRALAGSTSLTQCTRCLSLTCSPCLPRRCSRTSCM